MSEVGSLVVGNTLYVKLYSNRLHARHLQTARNLDLTAENPFSHPRLLVGDFANAESVLKQAIEALVPRGFLGLRLAPHLLLQPMERLEGGLTSIEQRLLLELGRGCGARKVHIHVGNELSDAEVKHLLSSSPCA